jgi:hypothetical protein
MHSGSDKRRLINECGQKEGGGLFSMQSCYFTWAVDFRLRWVLLPSYLSGLVRVRWGVETSAWT